MCQSQNGKDSDAFTCAEDAQKGEIYSKKKEDFVRIFLDSQNSAIYDIRAV
jgi:hypothetical protein